MTPVLCIARAVIPLLVKVLSHFIFVDEIVGPVRAGTMSFLFLHAGPQQILVALGMKTSF